MPRGGKGGPFKQQPMAHKVYVARQDATRAVQLVAAHWAKYLPSHRPALHRRAAQVRAGGMPGTWPSRRRPAMMHWQHLATPRRPCLPLAAGGGLPPPGARGPTPAAWLILCRLCDWLCCGVEASLVAGRAIAVHRL